MAQYVPCPKCGGHANKVGMTWWGGVIGPKILTHVKCVQCGMTYNGKTGKSNNGAIAIYSVVVLVILFAIIFAVTAMGG